MSKISKNIKKLRTASGMTQEELAVKLHVTRQTVSSWETDRTQPDLQILQSIAEIFAIEPEEIIYGKKRNTAEEKEKLLFGNTLITVLSVLGCLLIGAGVVMIFVKFWQDFPDVLKLITCFVPALLGQGFGIYTYIKKKESRAWCEGASVLWMLGVGVTTAIITNLASYIFVKEELIYIFLAATYFVLMLVFNTVSPMPVVYTLSIIWFEYVTLSEGMYHLSFDAVGGTTQIFRYSIAVLMEAVFIGCVIYTSKKLCTKEQNVVRYTFTEWISFVAVTVFVVLALMGTDLAEAFIPFVAVAALIFFAIGHKQKDIVSPYRVLGLPVTAAALCFFSIIAAVDMDLNKGVSIFVLVVGLLPVLLFTWAKTRPENIYLRLYGILATAALLIFNILTVMFSFRSPDYYKDEYLGTFKVYDFFEGMLLNLSFPVCLAALIMLIIYGAKERKLLYLNLGFILSCVSVIAKLYLLDLGLIMTGIMLIVCGAALLFVNLKFSRIREKEKLISDEGGEEELQ